MINKFDKFKGVCYDICGLVLCEVYCLEDEGYWVIKFNIGNLVLFGFEVFEELLQDVIYNLLDFIGYCYFKGLFLVCKVVMQYIQIKGIENVMVDDIIIGNGVLELIVMVMQVLFNYGDEVLLLVLDYLLWIVVVCLFGGNLVYYLCDEKQDW